MIKRILAASAALAMSAALGPGAGGQGRLSLPYTGIGAEFAQLVDRGMELYLKLNADKVKPYKITLIKRDVKNPAAPTPRSRCRSCSPRTTSTSSPAGSIRRTRSPRRRS